MNLKDRFKDDIEYFGSKSIAVLMLIFYVFAMVLIGPVLIGIAISVRIRDFFKDEKKVKIFTIIMLVVMYMGSLYLLSRNPPHDPKNNIQVFTPEKLAELQRINREERAERERRDWEEVKRLVIFWR